jgi:RNA polymerase sigma factor (sigma-70 family)
MSVSSAALSSAHFALLQRIIRSVARSNRLSPEDAEDFGQTVHVKLLERNYDVLDSYEGRSSLATFLTVVVTRLLLDWRNATRGKWRPSATAVRLGDDAVGLERLMHRDGLTRDEAIATLASRRPAPGADSLRHMGHIADQLPPRARRMFIRDVADEAFGHLDFDDPIVAADQRRRQRAVRRALKQACAALDPDERRLIALRYGRACSVRAIGDQLRTDPKPLYRRIDRVLKTLRHHMVSQGVEAMPVVADFN